MRIKSKWLGILLTMGLVLAACSPSSGDETTTTEGEATATTEGSTDTTEGSTDTTEGSTEIATDVGVDLEAGTIDIGLLSDLSGGFAGLVTPIVTGHEVYWENVNANGGIEGLTVNLNIQDTGYVVDNHVQKYEEMKDSVVALGHSTGSPHTVAINDQLQEDGILAIPLTWYSGWTDPALNANLLHHGSSYCVEAQNVIQWLTEQMEDISTIGIVSVGGDYGLDSAAGAVLAAEGLGLEVVVDLAGGISDEASILAAADQIAEASPDLVWMTLIPSITSALFGQALANGYQGIWAGAGPSFSPAFVAPDSPIKDAVTASMYFGFYLEGWTGTSAGTEAAKELLLGAGRDIAPFDYYLEGVLEAEMMHQILQAAYDAGDMTQAGVLKAAKAFEDMGFDGLGPNESFVGDPNAQLQRETWVMKPDPDGLVAGTSGGAAIAEAAYVGSLVEAFDFTGACYVLGS